MSITLHVNVNARVADAASVAANFGTPIFVAEHSVTADRQNGPYSGVAALEAAGFTASAAPEVNAWARAAFSQQSLSQVLIGRRAASEHIADTMAAIYAVDPAAFFAVMMAANSADDIMGLAAWTEPLSKISLAQASGAVLLDNTSSAQQVSTLTVGGTATSGDYVVTVRNGWTNAVIATVTLTADVPGTHADNDAIAAALRSAWDGNATLAAISAPAAGAGAAVEITFDGAGNSYSFDLTAPGAGTLTESTPAFAQNVGELGSALGYNNTAVVYHDDDTEYLDGAWAGRCLGFQLDAPEGAGAWAYQRLTGVTATSISDTRKTNLLSYPVNYYSPVRMTSGALDPGFTWAGQMLSGRFIDNQTTLHLTRARLEEGLLAMFIRRAASSKPKVPFTDGGIQLARDTALGVVKKLVRGSHYAEGAISSLTGRVTPYIDAPRLVEVSTADKVARRIRLTGEAVFAGGIQSVGDAQTVGLQIDLSF